jgi:hypothetical protein
MRKQIKLSPAAGIIISAALVFMLLVSAGCLTTFGKAINSSNAQSGGTQEETGSIASPLASDTSSPEVFMTAPVSAKITPLKTNITQDVLPILTPDPYPVLHGTRINETPQFDFRYRVPDFTKKYSLQANATGLLVNVVEGPLYIVYTIKPQYDCLAEPCTCRGSIDAPVTRPFMKITVRDNRTQEIVAEDGYGGEFSWDTGNYEFIATAQNIDGQIVTTTSMPGPRYIAIYREGVYHLTIEGNNLDVDLSIITGASPDPLAAAMQERQGRTVTPTMGPAPPPDETWE